MTELKQRYTSKINELREVLRWRKQACRLLQLTRGICFLLFGGCVIMALTGGLSGILVWLVPALPLIVLVVAAAYNETIEYRQQIDRVRVYLNQLQIRRIERNWSALPEIPFDVPENRFHVSKDLDLFGKASLFKLLCLAHTPSGIQKLGDWLLNPAEPKAILKRQKAVEALKSKSDLREELQLLSCTVAEAQTDPVELLDWSQGELWLENRKWLLWLSRLSAVVMLACWVLFFVPGIFRMLLGGIALGLLLLNIVISVVFAGSIHKIFNSVGYRQRDISTYVDLFHLAYGLPHDVEMLDEIRGTLYSGNQNAVATARQLQTIIGLAQMRRSGLMFLVYIVLQFLFLWDVHTLRWLESWHRQHAHQIPDWLNSIAVWESLSSLSNLAEQQPEWTFPTVEHERDRIRAEELGHPLLTDDQRVCNSVSVGPKGTILLVTGSNMSGKSTLLRSIGMNSALAQAGSVVCATRMEMPPVQIETSMRIGDSVSDGVSFFMAELKRLRQITVEAEKLTRVPERTLLYLLDEILQGTNSRERQIAVISVCQHLLDSGAIGAISTHDLELAEADSIKRKCQTVHFREFFQDNPDDGKKEMQFDYVMRQGVSPTTNALKLLEMVGLSPARKSSPSDTT